MNKTELMETYAVERIAEMVEKRTPFTDEELIQEWKALAEEFHNGYCKALEENNRLQSEVEKYHKAIEETKKERNYQIAEYQKKIEELYYSLKTLDGNLKVSNAVIEETIKNENGEKTNTVKFDSIKQFAEYVKCFYTVNLDYIQKVLQGEKINQNNPENITDFLPTEPIKVADMLITASKKRTNCMTGKEYDKYIFEKWQLRQIAEHLLVYCNHNEEAEE